MAVAIATMGLPFPCIRRIIRVFQHLAFRLRGTQILLKLLQLRLRLRLCPPKLGLHLPQLLFEHGLFALSLLQLFVLVLLQLVGIIMVTNCVHCHLLLDLIASDASQRKVHSQVFSLSLLLVEHGTAKTLHVLVEYTY
uniref:Uncharacterized protein n=1 Tax=Coccolithus braarudii TaxID=221442 RepID=A0A7S0PXL0_9EUKA